MNSSIATVFGGSGFVGRYAARRLARRGWRVRVACRRPNEAHFVRTYGVVGQVEPVLANVRDEASTRRAVEGADAVVNCVGILVEAGRQRFAGIHAEAAGRIAGISRDAGVGTFVHVSALGASPESPSEYARTKAEGERLVLAAFPDAAILRPSVVFGAEDQFFNRFARLARISPVIPLVGGGTRIQPVYVDDVAAAVEALVCGRGETAASASGVFELGGPDTETFRELMQRMLKSVRRRRLVVNAPFSVVALKARALDIAQFLSGGLFVNRILTKDQVMMLRSDNVVSEGAKTLADLGIDATSMHAVLDEYLYCYRPYGQYSALTESAKNLGERR